MRNITATRLGQIRQQETRNAQQRENDRQGSRSQKSVPIIDPKSVLS